ncbi:MAG: cyclic nucleotide-binding domain-containing protein [Polyangiales bacterium]
MITVIEQIARQPGLTHLGGEDRAALASCLRRRGLRRGEILFREGDVGDSLFFLEYGAVRLLTRDASRVQQTLTELPAGELLGEMACIDPAARSATAVAIHDSAALTLSRDGLYAMRAHCPTPARAVFALAARSLARRLGETHARIIERIGGPRRASSGVIPRADAPEAPRPLSQRVAGWFGRGGA